MSAADEPSTAPEDTPHAAPDYHDSGDNRRTEGAEDVISHIGKTSTGVLSDRIEHLDDASGDPSRVE